MKKRVIAIVLMLVFALTMSAYTVEPKVTGYTPSLSFDGTTAICKVTVIEYGKDIDATLTLYRGLSRIGYWSGSGTGVVSIKGECEVKDGLEYRLEVTGTVDGKAFTAQSVVGTC